ncbi:MAG: response regulator [Candidatus Gastranaerophilales bacterium]|nr:response regulator [Candidatus Gastranaerophilales bacterium]
MNKTIFIAEDNEINLKLVSDILISQGYSLLTARTGKNALNKIKLNYKKIDLVLMDIQLPEMSGFEVIEELRANNETKFLPIFVLSAHAMEHDLQKAQKAGCDDYITKPIRVTEFIKKINGFLKPQSPCQCGIDG